MTQECYHCGLPSAEEFSAEVNGVAQPFCCIGCQAVAQAINDGGLSDFYAYRDKKNSKAQEESVSYAPYDLDDIQEEFTEDFGDTLREARLNIGGISCAACAWLIEHHLKSQQGVNSVSVNVSTHQCRVVWDKSQAKLSDLFKALSSIGYRPAPAIASEGQEHRKQEYKTSLLRLGVAGLGMMQVGMVAVALHAGDIQGISDHWQQFLRWVSLLFATPVLLYSAKPFFVSAMRAIRLRHLNMDVPVSIALLLAYIASVWATISGTGEVYFDSVSMFTFFLLLGRFLEMRARHSSAFETENLTQLLPFSVEKIVGDSRELVPIKSLKRGDKVWVGPGDVLPCDGVVEMGESTVDESLITGESVGLIKRPGDNVLAGTINGDIALTVLVDKTGKETGIAAVERLVNQAALEKPFFVTIADRIASKFVALVLLISVVVGGYWFLKEPSQAIWIVLSVLVVTCPCALSLATPAALTAGTNRLRKMGLLIRAKHVIEVLPLVTHVIFDKTGTLTQGRLQIASTKAMAEVDQNDVLEIISAMEQHSAHPIAKAFEDISFSHSAEQVKVTPGAGIEGVVKGVAYRFGTLEFIASWETSNASFEDVVYPGDGLWQLLATKDELIAWVLLEDKPRDDLHHLFAKLSERAISVSILSGDRVENVRAFANQYHIENYRGAMLPEDKLKHISELQKQGHKVLMVGDGINDVPVLSGADVSIAMGSATQLAQTNADSVLLSEKLVSLAQVISLSTKVKKTIRQNLWWALGYNGLALPAAAMGWIPPYLAAIGMSLSSLVVVVNALRLGYIKY